jgi:hypothetical protein
MQMPRYEGSQTSQPTSVQNVLASGNLVRSTPPPPLALYLQRNDGQWARSVTPTHKNSCQPSPI